VIWHVHRVSNRSPATSNVARIHLEIIGRSWKGGIDHKQRWRDSECRSAFFLVYPCQYGARWCSRELAKVRDPRFSWSIHVNTEPAGARESSRKSASRRLAPSLDPPLPFKPFSARRLPCRPTRGQKRSPVAGLEGVPKIVRPISRPSSDEKSRYSPWPR
jgi:hypothetical protein